MANVKCDDLVRTTQHRQEWQCKVAEEMTPLGEYKKENDGDDESSKRYIISWLLNAAVSNSIHRHTESSLSLLSSARVRLHDVLDTTEESRANNKNAQARTNLYGPLTFLSRLPWLSSNRRTDEPTN